MASGTSASSPVRQQLRDTLRMHARGKQECAVVGVVFIQSGVAAPGTDCPVLETGLLGEMSAAITAQAEQLTKGRAKRGEGPQPPSRADFVFR